MSHIRAVLFDAADTLFYNEELVRRFGVLAETGDPRLRPASLRAWIAAVGGRGLWPEDSANRKQRLARWARFYTSAMREAGLGRAEAVRHGRYLAEAVVDPGSYASFPDVEPTLTHLESAGMLTGIVSNFDNLLAPILDRLDLSRRFPVVVTSYEVGCYKPDPRIFRVALRRLNVTPHAALFVGDSPYSDIRGARAARITPVLVDRAGTQPAVDCNTVAQLDDVRHLLT